MKSNDLPFMPWWPSDFMVSTRGWSVTAKGVYRELLDVQWQRGGLPSNVTELQRLIGASKAEWIVWRELVEPKFPVCEDGLRRNPRLEEHRQKSLTIRERNRQGAATTNGKRWGSKVVPITGRGAAP